MRLKSAYREKLAAEIPEPNIPEEPPQPSESVRVEFTNKTEPAVAVVSQDQYPEPDEATLALQNQLAHLKKSEALQREYAERMAQMAQQQQAQRPMSREEKVSTWRANGGDEGDISFLESHPEMIDRHDVTVAAAEEAARQGFERGTPEHRTATREIFHRHLGHQQAAPAGSVEPTPAFFEPPEPARSTAPPDRAAMYSAPVSRRDAGSPREPSPSQVKLSVAEQEIARAAGISPVEYARHKQRLDREKRDGTRQ